MGIVIVNYKQLNTCSITDSLEVIFHENNLLILKDKNTIRKVSLYNNKDSLCLVYGSVYSVEKLNKNENVAKIINDKFYKYQSSLFTKLDGRFLIFIYDKKNNRIYAIRDSLGFQHVYYTSNELEDLCISTSLNKIREVLKNSQFTINNQALNIYLTYQYLPYPFTMYKDINQLPPKSILSINRRIRQVLSYQVNRVNNDAEYANPADSIKEILIKSFKKQITGRENIGCFLSGGMDTSTNISLLCNKLQIAPKVFTASFQEKNYDETKYANIIARQYNLKHYIIKVTKEMTLELKKIVRLYENPIGDRAILPQYFVCKAAQSVGIESMVSGEGGDEFLGYPRNLEEACLGIEYVMKIVENSSLAKYYTQLTSVFSENERKTLLGINNNNLRSEEYLSRLYDSFGSVSSFEKIYYGQWNTWLIDNVLIKDNQLFEYYKMQYITPYMDIDLMTYLEGLSINNKIKGLKNKLYLKRAMNKFLPAAILRRKKHKFQVPISEWLKKDMYSFVREVLCSKKGFVNNKLDNKYVLKLLEDHRNNLQDNNRKIWALLFLDLWYNEHTL